MDYFLYVGPGHLSPISCEQTKAAICTQLQENKAAEISQEWIQIIFIAFVRNKS